MTNDFTNMGSEQTVSNSGHFSDYEFLPAVIVETDDPLKYGRIKCTALGAFNANTSTPEQLPWCYPFTMQGNNSFASYEKGSKVWIIRNKKRQDENWFIPMYEHHGMTQEFINKTKASDKPEVVSMRNKGGSQSSITYDHSGGYKMSTGGVSGGASVNVGTNGSSSISGGGSSVNVKDGDVSLGSPGQDPHPAVLGDKLTTFIYEFFTMLAEFCIELIETDPMTAPAALIMLEWMQGKLQSDDIKNMLSETVKICETTAADKAAKEAEDARIQEINKNAEQGKVTNGTDTIYYKGDAVNDAYSVTSNTQGQILGKDGKPIYYTGDAASVARSVSGQSSADALIKKYVSNTAATDQTSNYSNKSPQIGVPPQGLLTLPNENQSKITVPTSVSQNQGYDRYNSVLSEYKG